MKGRRSVKTNLNVNKENKHTINSPTVFGEIFNKKLVIFATGVGDPTTQELKECIKNIDNNDDKIFAFPTNSIEVFNTVGNLKNSRDVAIVFVSAEALKTVPPLNFFN